MQTETIAAKALRGTVKTVFIACYIAFMWASIHHIAAFYNGFEENSGNLLGSYLLAGAVDITALVTTIAVMFFRKSMPGWVFWIVWTFIVALAFYSFFINWEYANHYQSMTLVLQPTGETVPVYDTSGVLHYVPSMRADTGLLWVNPVLASGFTVFSLIYSVVAEFFGTKAVTIEELQAKKKYLQETASVLQEIKQLEEKNRGASFIQRAKETVKEARLAVKEVLEVNSNDESPTSEESVLSGLIEEVDREGKQESNQRNNHLRTLDTRRDNESEKSSERGVKQDKKVSEHSSASRVYIPVQEAVNILGYDLSYIKSLRTKGVLKASRKNSDLISMASVKALVVKKQSAVKKHGEEESTTEGLPGVPLVMSPSVEECSERNTESVNDETQAVHSLYTQRDTGHTTQNGHTQSEKPSLGDYPEMLV